METYKYYLDPAFPGLVWRFQTGEYEGQPVVGGKGEFKAEGNNAWYPSSTVVLDHILDGQHPTPVADLPAWVLAWENEGGAL